jgi:hypothetical protein
MDTVIRRAAILLYRAAPNAGMAVMFKRPRSTVKSWITGRRRPPVHILRELQSSLRRLGADALTLAAEIDHIANQRENEPIRRQGFFVVRERDGVGTVPRDARWSGGQKRNS